VVRPRPGQGGASFHGSGRLEPSGGRPAQKAGSRTYLPERRRLDNNSVNQSRISPAPASCQNGVDGTLGLAIHPKYQAISHFWITAFFA
jgi:hypothetical protein